MSEHFVEQDPEQILTDPEASTIEWYILKQAAGHCDIVSSSPAVNPSDDAADAPKRPSSAEAAQVWGPFSSQEEAIAKRVGLIRSGRCKPV